MEPAVLPVTTALLEVVRVDDGRNFVDPKALELFLAALDQALAQPDALVATKQVLQALGYVTTHVKELEVMRPLYLGIEAALKVNFPRLRDLARAQGEGEKFDGQTKDFAKMLAPPPTQTEASPSGPGVPFKRPKNVQG